MKEVKKKVKMIKAEDGAVALPILKKMDDGNYVVLGTVDVSKMSEIREYLKEYKEVSDLIRGTYRREIANIFHSALGELVGRTALPSGDNSSQRVPVEALGGEFNDTEYLSRATIGRGLSQKTIERILASNGVGVKRYKPGNEITQLMQAADSTGYMILPEMSDNGVVAMPDKHTNTISLKFRKFNGEDASIIKNYLLSVADTVEGGEVCKQKIEEMFDTSSELAEVDTPYSDLEKHLLGKLGQEAVDLMGVDLTPFKKKTNTKVQTPNLPGEESGNDGLDGSENLDQDLVYDDNGNGTDQASGKITKLVVKGLNKFAQDMVNGQYQIALSPMENGVIYTIKIDGNELVAEQVHEEPSRE